MEPIISPWIVYAISVMYKLNVASFVVAVLAFVVSFLVYMDNATSFNEKEKENAFATAKKPLVVAIISCLLAIVIPDKETMLTMLAVNFVTPDNIQLVQGNITDFVGQIARAVAENAK